MNYNFQGLALGYAEPEPSKRRSHWYIEKNSYSKEFELRTLHHTISQHVVDRSAGSSVTEVVSIDGSIKVSF